MKSEIHLSPESEEEVELLEQLSEARTYALEEADMDPEELATVFAQFASGMFQESNAPGDDQSVHHCPQCGQLIEDVESPGLGMDPVVVPCGCPVEHERLPQELYLEDG